MMDGLLNDALLKKLLRVVPEKEFLFRQGDRGTTMFLIIEGRVQLTQKTLNLTRFVENLGSGDILGEKVIVADDPHRRRTMNAVALTELAVLEFDHQQLQLVQSKVPNFTLRILKVVTERLDKANDLIGVLQLKNDTEKLVQYLLFYLKYNGKRSAKGMEMTLPMVTIVSNLNATEEHVNEVLNQLAKQKAILRDGDNIIIPDETALVSYIPSLKDRIAA